MVWWWHLLRKRYSRALNLKVSSIVSISSHLCLISPRSRCNFLAFRTHVLLRLLLDLDTYGGINPLGVFPLFLKMVADIIAPKLSIHFRGLIR